MKGVATGTIKLPPISTLEDVFCQLAFERGGFSHDVLKDLYSSEPAHYDDYCDETKDIIALAVDRWLAK